MATSNTGLQEVSGNLTGSENRRMRPLPHPISSDRPRPSGIVCKMNARPSRTTSPSAITKAI